MVKCSWSDSQSSSGNVVHVCLHLVRRQTLKSPRASHACAHCVCVCVCVVTLNETVRVFHSILQSRGYLLCKRAEVIFYVKNGTKKAAVGFFRKNESHKVTWYSWYSRASPLKNRVQCLVWCSFCFCFQKRKRERKWKLDLKPKGSL